MRAKSWVLALLLCLPLSDRGAAQPQPDALPGRLSALVREAGVGDQVGIAVADATTGRVLFEHHPDLALNPASNMKLLTAAAALLRLGGQFTMLTGLYGRIDNGAVETLVLRGHGDPTLRMSDLVELAEELRDDGVRRVGEVVVDGSYFDERILPPAFEQQPQEAAYFRAAVSAVAVERSAYVLRVIPGRSAGLAPEVRLDAPGYFQVESTITTTDGGEANVIAIQRDQGMTMQLLLRGAVPAGILGVSYRRRVESPLAFAAHAMVEALDRAGIRASGRVRVAAVSEPMPLLAARRSPPLAHLLSAMGKESDNFTAEMVLKVLGAERRRPGSSESGLLAVREVLAEAGVTSDRIELVNGSGLFNGNRVGAGHIVALLTHVYRDEAVRSEYVSHLAIAGVDGTLERRLTDLPAPRIVRAKTGTLNDVIALSGYVLGPEPSQALAFSVLVNGARGRQSAARQLADRVATVLAESLHRSAAASETLPR